MNKRTLAFTLVAAIALSAFAETPDQGDGSPGKELRGNDITVGAGLMDCAGDFGLCGSVTTPWFFRKTAAIRAGGFVLWRNGADWIPYYGAKLGLVGGSFMANGDIRLYGEGGGVFLFPSARFDEDPFVFGGYGLFGFEFFIDRTASGLSYFIELGSNGIGAKAEKETGSPIYMNGFSTSVGLRWYP